MVSDVVTIEPGTGVVDADKRMIEQEKGPLPIVEGERPVAIVTDRDISYLFVHRPTWSSPPSR
jgi:CBS domain-containing protein